MTFTLPTYMARKSHAYDWLPSTFLCEQTLWIISTLDVSRFLTYPIVISLSVHGGVCRAPSTVWLVGVDTDHGVTTAWPLDAGQLEQVAVFTLWGDDGTDRQQSVQVLCAAGSCKCKTQHYTRGRNSGSPVVQGLPETWSDYQRWWYQ